jgi:FAD/FMN-containing dehydrogenase
VSRCRAGFWWRDKVSELSLRHIDPEDAARFREIPDHPANRAFITRTRHELRDLKAALDPEGILNPGNLGF